MTYLELYDNQLTDVPKGLEKLTQLTNLELYDNRLTDVKGLEKLTQLTHLTLTDNQLTSVTGLEKLTHLEWLSLGDNQLTDVKGLEKLTKLETLWLDLNPDLTKAQIDQLKKALPKCTIYRYSKLETKPGAKPFLDGKPPLPKPIPSASSPASQQHLHQSR